MVSDITYIPTDEGWLYLAGVMDLCGDKIVGISMDERMTKELVIAALKDAIRHTAVARYRTADTSYPKSAISRLMEIKTMAVSFPCLRSLTFGAALTGVQRHDACGCHDGILPS